MRWKWAGGDKVGGADGKGGLAHAALAVDEGAPTAVVRREGVADLRQLRLAAEEGLEAGEVVGNGGMGRDEWGRANGEVVVFGVAFVEGEAFEGFGFDAGEPGEHDLLPPALLEEAANGLPFQAAPFLFFVVGTQDGDDEVGVVAIEFGEVGDEIVLREFGAMVLVVENGGLAEALREKLGHLGDKSALLSGKGEGDAKSAGHTGAEVGEPGGFWQGAGDLKFEI